MPPPAGTGSPLSKQLARAAKSKHWINQREKEDASELGRKLMEKEARKFKTTWKKVLLMDGLNRRISAEYGLQKPEDIYPGCRFRQNCSAPDTLPAFPGSISPFRDKNKLRHPIGSPKSVWPDRFCHYGQGQDGLLVYRAKCCNPIRGDEIVGYITRGKGISVHTTACPNLVNFFGSERMTEVEWVNVPGMRCSA